MLELIKRYYLIRFFRSNFASIGLFWLGFNSYYQLQNVHSSDRIGFVLFLFISVGFGTAWFFLNGLVIKGYMIPSIEIKSNAIATSIKIFFGDIFSQKGWKIISVNEYFDSTVDENYVASQSLHGSMIRLFWGGNVKDWDSKIDDSLNRIPYEQVLRNDPGKKKKYGIGITARASIKDQDFLCVALTHTDIDTNQASCTLEDLNIALHSVLSAARSTCSGAILNIPLLGSGLARTGVKPVIILNLIILAIFEESKKQKITDNINIVISDIMKRDIDLISIKTIWS